jgi:hypothetical protein
MFVTFSKEFDFIWGSFLDNFWFQSNVIKQKKAAGVFLSGISNSQLECVNPDGSSLPSMKIEFKQIQNQTVKLKPEDGRIKGSVTLGPRPRFL